MAGQASDETPAKGYGTALPHCKDYPATEKGLEALLTQYARDYPSLAAPLCKVIDDCWNEVQQETSVRDEKKKKRGAQTKTPKVSAGGAPDEGKANKKGGSKTDAGVKRDSVQEQSNDKAPQSGDDIFGLPRETSKAVPKPSTGGSKSKAKGKASINERMAFLSEQMPEFSTSEK